MLNWNQRPMQLPLNQVYSVIEMDETIVADIADVIVKGQDDFDNTKKVLADDAN